jgi:hypothetical protein
MSGQVDEHTAPMLAVRAYFLVDLRDGDPALVTDATGLAPTETWRAGDPFEPNRKGGRPRRNFSGWVMGSAATDPIYLEPHVRSVLEQLRPGWHALVAICRDYEAALNCVVNCHLERSTPSLHLDPDMVRALAELGAQVDFDLYVWDTLVS